VARISSKELFLAEAARRDDPAKLAASLVAQIVALFPAHPEPEADAGMHPVARLQSTLQRVSQHQLVPHRQRLVVLIDALDEYDPPAGSRALRVAIRSRSFCRPRCRPA